jgi:GT2 family glycosyltransferase
MATVREALAPANGGAGIDSYALTLRAIESDNPIVRHLPYVLYHRKARQSCPHGAERKRRTVENHLRRRYGAKAPQVVTLSAGGERRIVWRLPDPEPLVSLIIPTRDRVDLLKACVEGLRHGTAYRNMEIIVVDNNSVEPETLAYFDEIRSDGRVHILNYTDPFNFSAINNFAVKHAHGDVIGLINNDLKVIDEDWLREMVSHAMRPEVGAVGAMLYYGDDTIQHAGVILGIGTVASHVFKRQSKDSSGYARRAKLTQDLSAVTAACMLMRRAVFDRVGGLDATNFAIAYNDVDLCLRIRKAGYLVVWTPFARLYHLESASRGRDTSGANKTRFAREKARMLDRWGALLLADPYYSPNLALDSVDCRPAFPPRVTPPWKSQP